MITKYNKFIVERKSFRTKDILEQINKYENLSKEDMYRKFSSYEGYYNILKKLQKLGSWLYTDAKKVDGKWIKCLGLDKKIKTVLYANKLTSDLSKEEKDKFKEGIGHLLNTNIDKVFIVKKLKSSIAKLREIKNKSEFLDEWKKIKTEDVFELADIFVEEAFLVKDDQLKWAYTNKLNTNIYAIAHMLANIIIRSLLENSIVEVKDISVNQFGKEVYDVLTDDTKDEEDVKNVLFKYKDLIGNLIHVYYGSYQDKSAFDKYVEIIKDKSVSGDLAEKAIFDILQKNLHAKLIYSGGDGDFIDMLFGIDLIVDIPGEQKYTTVQVKSYRSYNQNIIDTKLSIIEENRYEKIDFLAFYMDGVIEIYNNRTKKYLDLE